MGFLRVGEEAVTNSCLFMGEFSTYWIASSSLNLIVSAWSYTNIFCHVWLMSLGGLLFPEVR